MLSPDSRQMSTSFFASATSLAPQALKNSLPPPKVPVPSVSAGTIRPEPPSFLYSICCSPFVFLVELGAAFLHHLGPLGEVGEHELAEILGRAADRLGAVGEDPLANVRSVQDPDQFGVQTRHDRRRHAGRPDDAVPA